MGRDKNIEIRHLRYFASMCEEGSVSRAAKRLRVSPGTVWRRIRELERTLNVKLLVRKGGSVTLTDAGKLMRSHSRNVLKYLEIAMEGLHTAERPFSKHRII